MVTRAAWSASDSGWTILTGAFAFVFMQSPQRHPGTFSTSKSVWSSTGPTPRPQSIHTMRGNLVAVVVFSRLLPPLSHSPAWILTGVCGGAGAVTIVDTHVIGRPPDALVLVWR